MHHESVGWHTKGANRSHVIKGKSGHKDVEENVVRARKEVVRMLAGAQAYRGYSLHIYCVVEKVWSVGSKKSTSRH